MFAPRSGTSSSRSGTRVELNAPRRHTLPTGFDPVGEALASERGVADVCAVVGRDLADDGLPLVEALAWLRETSLSVTGAEPPFQALSALAGAWSDATLGYLHQLSCEDPLSGLATPAHLRTRLAELFRAHAGAVHGSHGLVVLELGARSEGSLDTALRLARVAGLARTVWPGDETIAQVARLRVAVLARRDDALGRRLSLLGTLVGDDSTRLWVEGLPHTETSAAALLDELARD